MDLGAAKCAVWLQGQLELSATDARERHAVFTERVDTQNWHHVQRLAAHSFGQQQLSDDATAV